jgi:hypothetical protein
MTDPGKPTTQNASSSSSFNLLPKILRGRAGGGAGAQKTLGAGSIVIASLAALAMYNTLQKSAPRQEEPEVLEQYKTEIKALYPGLQSFDVDTQSYSHIHELLQFETTKNTKTTISIIMAVDELLTLEHSLQSGIGERGVREDIHQAKATRANIMEWMEEILRSLVQSQNAALVVRFSKDVSPTFNKWIANHVDMIEHLVGS